MLLDSVNAIEFATLDGLNEMLCGLFTDGHRVDEMRMGADAEVHFAHLAEERNAVIRIRAVYNGPTVAALRATGYVHPATGEIIKITRLPGSPWRVEFHTDA